MGYSGKAKLRHVQFTLIVTAAVAPEVIYEARKPSAELVAVTVTVYC